MEEKSAKNRESTVSTATDCQDDNHDHTQPAEICLKCPEDRACDYRNVGANFDDLLT